MAVDYARLMSLHELVVRHFKQSDWTMVGTLSGQLPLIEAHSRLLRSLYFGDDDYSDAVMDVLAKLAGKDDGFPIKQIEQYVASRFVDGTSISSTQGRGTRLYFQPSVFEIPEEPLNPKLVSVMMPFDASMGGVYTTIKSAADDNAFLCLRADDIWDASTVIQDVFSLIFRSFIVVCDFTGKNPNVFYEAGIAHTLGKHVIPITQSDGDIPFDLRHHRQLRYLNNGEGLAVLRTELGKRIATLDKAR